LKRVLRFSKIMLMLTMLFTLASCSEKDKSGNEPDENQVEEQNVYSSVRPFLVIMATVKAIR
jgi:hypothetical protein